LSLTKRRYAPEPPARDLDSEHGAFLQALVVETRVLTGGQAAALCLTDSSSARILMAAGSGGFADRVGQDAPAHAGLSGMMIAAPQPVSCVSCDGACCPFAPSIVHRHLAVPVHEGTRVRGVLCATSSAGTAPRAHSEAMLARLARLAGSCLADEPVCGLAEDLGALAERQKIAADMHDSVAQNLAALHVQLDSVLSDLPADCWPQVLRMRDTLQGTIDELRALIESLHSPRDPVQTHEGLAAVLRAAARDSDIAKGVLSVYVGHDVLVPRPVAAEVRRIVMEALTNADRHAQASTIRVGLHCAGKQAIVSVADNGSGLAHRDAAADTSEPPATGAHFGMDVMRLRAAVIGGQLEIRSAPGGGTEVELRWPEITP
jgi:signal transduction histidine kinase